MAKRTATAWVIGCLATGSAYATATPTAFGPGEQSTYSVRYLGLTAGDVQLTVGAPIVKLGHTVWPIVGTANTIPGMVLFPVHDRLVSYWDASARRSMGSDLLADEGRHRRRQRVELNLTTQQATVTLQKEGQAPTTRQVELPSGAADITGVIFAIRDQPLEVGRVFETPVFTGATPFRLRATVEEKQTLATALGPRDVFRIRAETQFAGEFRSKHDLIAYLTTDATHVPVRLEEEFQVGTLTAELTHYLPGNVSIDTTQTPAP